jgi:hypothetical protein
MVASLRILLTLFLLAVSTGTAQQAVVDMAETAQTERVILPDVAIPYTPARMASGSVIYDNGPYVTHPNGGPNGTHASILQNSTLGMTILGFGINAAATPAVRVADDFTITDPDGWRIDSITVNGYVTNADTTVPPGPTGINVRIWDGIPESPGSNVVFGDTTTNRLLSTYWNREVRISQTTVNIARALKITTGSIGVTLPPGTYWVEWGVTGLSFAPPVTITGDTVTGNARQRGSAGWVNLLDGTKPQGMPFLLHGEVLGGGGGGQVTATRSGVNKFVPDNNPAGILDTLIVSGVPANSQITMLSFRIDSLIHTWVGDFRMTIAKDGVTRTAMNRPGTGGFGSSGDNFIGTVLTDTATARIDSIAPAGAPYTGFFRPDSGGAPTIVPSSFTPFNGMDPNGMWILHVSDNAAGDTGRVHSWSLIIDYEAITSVDPNDDALPQEFVLHQNYPNPFNPSTTISYSVPRGEHVRILIYDVLGREIATLVDGPHTAGTHSVVWNATGVSSGMYFYRLQSNSFSQTRKLMFLK